MDFSSHIRLKVRVTPADVGKRVSVLQLIEDAQKGETFTDTVGVLTSWDGGVLLITRRSGERVRIPEASLVAGKVVPSAPARRRGPSASYEELARVASRGWQPEERERLGDWELRAAAGFTRRANSVLPLGDPGVPLDEALALVRDWYAARGLPAYVQTATGAEGTQELLPDLVAHELGGHSDGVSVITLGEGRERAIFWSDVVPTTHHVQPPYIMAYDLDVVKSFEVRSQWLEEAARGNWLGMFFHDEHVPFARIVKDGRRYRCEPIS